MEHRVRQFDSYSELPDRYAVLLGEAQRQGLYSSRDWFDLLQKHRYTKGQPLRLYAVEELATQRPVLLMPLYVSRSDRAALGAYTFAAIAHLENYAPVCLLVDPAAQEQLADALLALFGWLADGGDDGHFPVRADVIRLAPFVAFSERGEMVFEALKAAGFAVQIYDNSYNQYEDCTGQSYEQYLAGRSSNQRYNSRRRRRKLEKQGDIEFQMITDAEDEAKLRDAVDDYILVAVHSWKSRESTISRFIMDWMQMAARTGYLRLGILKLDGRAIAAQFWVCSGGVANLVRTNFREDYRDLAPGVVLTNMVIEYLLDVDHANSLDLGYGDEDYKGRWVDGARGYRGIIAFNPRTLRGYYHGHRHILGQPLKRLVDRGRAALVQRGAV